MATDNAMISKLSTSQKFNGTNCVMWKWKIRYRLNERDLWEHLTVAKFSLSDKDKDGKPIDITTVQYQESLQAYQD